MDTTQNVGGRDRLVRLVLTVVLSIVAVRWLKNGKRLRGLLAGSGALGIGFTATTGYCGVNEALGIDTAGDDGSDSVGVDFETADESDTGAAGDVDDSHTLYCAACGDPIVPGQSRGPDEDGEIVHDRCA